MTIHRGRNRLSMTSSRVSGKNEELTILNMENFGLSRHLRILGSFGGRVVVKWERNDEFSRVSWSRGDGDVVFHESGISFGLLAEAAFLVCCSLEEDIKVVSVNSQTLKTVVIVSSRRVVCWDNIITCALGCVKRRGVGREGLSAVSHGNNSIRRSDGTNHDAERVEAIDVRSIFVTDPEAPVCIEDNALGVNWDALPTWPSVAKPISLICCNWQVRKPWIAQMPSPICIETSRRCAIRAIETDRLFVCKE